MKSKQTDHAERAYRVEAFRDFLAALAILRMSINDLEKNGTAESLEVESALRVVLEKLEPAYDIVSGEWK